MECSLFKTEDTPIFLCFLNHEGLKAIEKYDNIKDKTDITVDIGMKGRII